MKEPQLNVGKSLVHVNPVHIGMLLDAVLRLYLYLVGMPRASVYPGNDERILVDWDELIAFVEDVNDGIPEIRGRRRDGDLEEEDGTQ